MTHDEAVREEQKHVDRAYERLEQLRNRAEQRRREALAASVTTHADLVDRDATAFEAAARVQALTLGDEEPLVFGRLDREDGEVHHIGRVSVLSDDYEPLVVDWRSPAGEAFYRATPAEPLGVQRRRVIHCRGSDVLRVEDQLLDVDEIAAEEHYVGDAALMAALTRDRSDQMRDIVATIQREQDEIIRLPARGIVVVSGGPGTGKTVVALHRVAYLLYRHRNRLESRGVLVVAPSRVFADYIRGVLPSLGETRALLLPLGDWVAGLETDRHDAVPVAAVKGDGRMSAVLRRYAEQLRPTAKPDVAFRRLRRGEITIHELARDLFDSDSLALVADAWSRDEQAGVPPSVEDIALVDELASLLERPATPREAPSVDDVDQVTTFADRTRRVDPGDFIAVPGYAGFGHVVVDEAQDLSVMQWRMVARRGREASWTVVGDLAQRTMPAGPDRWEEVAALLARPEVEIARLSVNYRTSAAIMEVASRLLPVVAPGQGPPHSPRRSDLAPRILTGVEDVTGRTVEEARDLREALSGTVAVAAPRRAVEELAPRLAAENVRVLDPWNVRGLEFDAIVVTAPEQIVADVGYGALYVALTRATQRLVIVTGEPALPGPLAGEARDGGC